MAEFFQEVLVTEGVSKCYLPGHPYAVKEVNLSLGRGEILSIVGPNGAGKSTLIQMMLGLLIPDSGRVRIFGHDVARDRRRMAHRINYASTDLSLPYSLTVRENLLTYALIYNMKKARERVEFLLSFLDLESFADRKVGALSTGQVARMGIAKALVNDPEILFLDEPTATLDPEISGQLRHLLGSMVRERGMALLYTSHNMREVERFSDRIILMRRGEIAAEGTASTLMERFRTGDLEELFLLLAGEREVEVGG